VTGNMVLSGRIDTERVAALDAVQARYLSPGGTSFFLADPVTAAYPREQAAQVE